MQCECVSAGKDSQSAHVGVHRLTCKHFTTGTFAISSGGKLGPRMGRRKRSNKSSVHPGHPYGCCSRFEVQFCTATDFPPGPLDLSPLEMLFKCAVINAMRTRWVSGGKSYARFVCLFHLPGQGSGHIRAIGLLGRLRKWRRGRKSKTLRLHNRKLKEEIEHKLEINLLHNKSLILSLYKSFLIPIINFTHL